MTGGCVRGGCVRLGASLAPPALKWHSALRGAPATVESRFRSCRRRGGRVWPPHADDGKGSSRRSKGDNPIPDLMHDDKRSRAPSSSPTSAPRVFGRATRHHGWTPSAVARSTNSRPRLSPSRPAARQRASSSHLVCRLGATPRQRSCTRIRYASEGAQRPLWVGGPRVTRAV